MLYRLGCIFMVYLNISEVRANCKTPGHNFWRALWSHNAYRTLLASTCRRTLRGVNVEKQNVISWYFCYMYLSHLIT